MIAALFKYKLIMNKNRFANMPLAEKLAYASAVIVIAGFVALMTAMCLKKADRIIEFINPGTFPYFNYLSAVALNLILMTAISIEAFTEVEEIYYRRETQFILQFPNDFAKFFAYKLIEISLKILPVLVLLFPLGLLYAFFIFKYHGAAVIFNFAVYAVFSLAVVLAFSAAVVMAFAAVIARLLSVLRQRTIVLALALGLAAVLCFYFPALKDSFTQKSAVKEPLANIYNSVKGAAGWVDVMPASLLAEGAAGILDGGYAVSFANVFYSLLITLAAIVISWYANTRFLFREIGSLLDKVSLRQNSSGSVAYFRLLEIMPAVWRGAVYDEICHAIRKSGLLVFLIMAPVVFALPFYLPAKFFEAVRTANKYWIFFAINSVFLMSGSEFMAGDLVTKRAFMQLVRPLSVELKEFFAVKIVFYWLVWAALLSFASGPWIYFIGFNSREFLEVFALILLWSAAAPLICYGVGSLAHALFSSRKDPDGLQPADPAVQIIIFITLAFMCISSLKLYNSGLEMPWIYSYIVLWLAAAFFTLAAGVRKLEKKEL